MKTKTLRGALLDRWVARALQTRIDGRARFEPVSGQAPRYYNPRNYPLYSEVDDTPAYSVDWAAAGVVIDRMSAGRNGICLTGSTADGFEANHAAGDTPLIALMRSFVVSIFGTDLPDEIHVMSNHLADCSAASHDAGSHIDQSTEKFVARTCQPVD